RALSNFQALCLADPRACICSIRPVWIISIYRDLWDSRLAKLVLVILVIGAAFRFSADYSQLPDVVASHFNAAGHANGWQTKTAFFSFFVGSVVLAVFFAFGLPAMIRAMPIQLFNLPNKNYWLAGDQREPSLEFLSAWFAWLGCAIFVVACYAFHFAIQANLRPEAGPGGTQFAYVLAAFGLFCAFWMVLMFRRFGTRDQR